MKTILTLTIGGFELVHDVLSLLIAAMGASALFFLLSRKQVAERFQPLLLIAGIVAAIGCYHSIRLFYSWNEAFELAGNSYAASGHFFHEFYRYSDWVLTMPLLLIELVLVSACEKKEWFLNRVISAALISVLFTYLGATSLGEYEAGMRWGCWALAVIPFLYLARLLMKRLSLQQGLSGERFFLKARRLFLLSWAFYLLASLLSLCNHGLGETGLVIYLVGAGIADLISKCGVSFCLYRILLAQEK